MYQQFTQSEACRYITRRFRAQLHGGSLRCRFTVLSGAASIEGPYELTSESASLEIAQWPSLALPSNNRFERSVMHKVPDARWRVHLLQLRQPRAIGGRAAAQPHR